MRVSRPKGGGILVNRNLGNGFSAAAHHTFGLSGPKARVIRHQIVDSHAHSGPGGFHSYTLHHTSLNPYKSAGVLAGAAVTGYGAYKGAKYYKQHRGDIHRSVGNWQMRHSKGIKNLGVAVSGASMVLAKSNKGPALGVASGIGINSYGSHLQRKQFRRAQQIRGKTRRS